MLDHMSWEMRRPLIRLVVRDLLFTTESIVVWEQSIPLVDVTSIFEEALYLLAVFPF